MRYRTEKDLIIEHLWKIVMRELNHPDDAGCDWFTMGNKTCIAHTDWCVSSDPEIAKLINAINALNGYPQFICATYEDVPENMRWQEDEPEDVRD